MAANMDCERRAGLDVGVADPSFAAAASKKERNGKHCGAKDAAGKKSQVSANHVASDSDGGESGAASFSTNHNSVVCLPLVSEGLKLVWTQSDQTRELDAIPELVQAFNVFPYPTSREVSGLARLCALPLDKVKVWFMVQRIKYGISWASEDIEETRRKLAGLEHLSEHEDEVKARKRKGECDGFVKQEDHLDVIEGALHFSPHPPLKRPKAEPPAEPKPPSAPRFRSSLPPPQDSYYYRNPVDTPAVTAASPGSQDTPVGSQQPLVPPPLQQQQQHQRRGRYKKSKAQLAVLRCSFLREKWPAETELRRLQDETGLSRNDIRKWFSDCRYQLRNGRAGPAITASPAGRGGKSDSPSQQLQPLPLVAHGPRNEQKQNGLTAKAPVTKGKFARDGEFFQNFLSSKLEAFVEEAELDREYEDKVKDRVSQEDSGDKTDEYRAEEEAESEDEQPLKLSRHPSEPETLAPMAATAAALSSSSPSSSATSSPASVAAPPKCSSQTTAGSAKAGPAAASLAPPHQFTPAGRPRKTKEQLDVLKQHFLRCQWPKSEDYTQLVELTALPRADVIQWFGDTRYAVKNGQLRWVQGVRDQLLADIASQQSSPGGGGGAFAAAATNATSSTRTSRGGGGGGGSRKRKSHGSGSAKTAAAATDLPDVQPLELYHRQNRVLQEKDLDALCRKSRMSYQQVRDWFASRDGEAPDP
ncbi:homeobox and leucine zipper encoding a [Denticeps clupeoides]|uniref:homeobox and leucine zipper encoding a n=1 Tax=Denticeps clupeoides TaxID=299321 RepID=UPI0010A40C46|nr:zinc fingers and homeoboxes protein 1-like [Denticeps clupeoides]XP_028834084.1 zinc fingers and homeoboxes protein 1-like [Denticeps clupeoides]